jgi:hypothetical protein
MKNLQRVHKHGGMQPLKTELEAQAMPSGLPGADTSSKQQQERKELQQESATS